jgi:hypothetical protein
VATLAPILHGILEQVTLARTDPEGLATRLGAIIAIAAFFLAAAPTGYWTYWMFEWAKYDHEEKVQKAFVDQHPATSNNVRLSGLSLCEDHPRREGFLAPLTPPAPNAIAVCHILGRRVEIDLNRLHR